MRIRGRTAQMDRQRASGARSTVDMVIILTVDPSTRKRATDFFSPNIRRREKTRLQTHSALFRPRQ